MNPSTFSISVEECREIAVSPHPIDRDVMTIGIAVSERSDALTTMLDRCVVEKRGFKADEQREYERLTAEHKDVITLHTLARTKYQRVEAEKDAARSNVA